MHRQFHQRINSIPHRSLVACNTRTLAPSRCSLLLMFDTILLHLLQALPTAILLLYHSSTPNTLRSATGPRRRNIGILLIILGPTESPPCSAESPSCCTLRILSLSVNLLQLLS
jgi:hypothetical protein